MGIFLFVDLFMKFFEIEGRYYLNHFLANLMVLILVSYDTITLLCNPYDGFKTSISIYASIITYALHFYHIILYFYKFSYFDWLHHGTMIFIALPIANYFGSVKLLGHSLFYLTGLPGMIDYLLLFLTRNNYIERLTEKKINVYLNCYLRCPGCVIHFYITLLNLTLIDNLIDKLFAVITAGLVFWNGIYFMEKVVGNYHLEKSRNEMKKIHVI